MKSKVGLLLITVVLVSGISPLLLAEEKQRSEIPIQHTWKLEDIYPSDQAWEEAMDSAADRFDRILEYKGRLGDSASTLLQCLKLNTEISKQLSRLGSYAAMKADQDTRDSKYLAMRQKLEQLATDYGANASFIVPEVAAMTKEKIDKFLTEQDGLAIYKMPLYDILRTKEHTLSAPEEKILAQSSLFADSAQSIYAVFSDAELPWPEIELSDGTKLRLSKAAYTLYRASPNRVDRETVFNAFWGKFNDFRRTLGVTLYSEVKKNIFYARVRSYKSPLELSLDKNNIPTEVYTTLIENANNNLDTLHRYLKLKKRMLGVDTLKYSDLYAPTVKGVDLKYTFEQARELILDSLKPLGEDYIDTAKKAFAERWMDVYPTPGKRSGAYSNGSVYDVHPYILLNYNGRYEDVSTIAHELGHTMHSYYSNKNQPYPTADYSIFVAEVASTFNETLLIEKMLSEITDRDTRLSLLMDYLENARLTVFRQTQFAEFEMRIHELADSGQPLTGDSLTQLYGDILRKYYGHDKGICQIDDLYCVEWAYIPHFYYNFYIYQYATSFTASTALARKVLDKEPGAADRYIREMLSAGSSDYPIEILRKAGVDMTTSEPFDKTIEAMNKTMNLIEKIIEK